MKIEIYTRSMNWKLYQLSQNTITLPYKRNRCRFTTADGYFYDRVLKSKADYIVNIDEDAFVTDNDRLQNLLEFCIKNDYVNCGVSDGGVMAIRKHNPLVTNPFFNIINVAKIRKEFDLANVIKNYNTHQIDFEKHAPTHLLRYQYAYDFYEPYVPFFLWLDTSFKTLFLDAREHVDGHSNIVLDHEGKPFVLHAWYSRLFGKEDFHTARIKNLYKEATHKEMPEKYSILDKLTSASDCFGKEYHDTKNRVKVKLGLT